MKPTIPDSIAYLLLIKKMVPGTIIPLRRRSFNRGQNPVARWRIKFVSVEAKEQVLSNVVLVGSSLAIKYFKNRPT
ncbi:hypothetical protein ACYX34_17605 [Nitrospira sp. CMX1]